jgi:tRNA wybutosine-synthesizing protein 2
MARQSPYEKIVAIARGDGVVPPELVELLPSRWEFLGDILTVKLPAELVPHGDAVGELYGGVLGVRSVVRETGGITGATRRPQVELIYGSDTRTVHLENGIRYHMDVTKVMFASGNLDERMRVANLDCSGETVVDMFAGIGYFTLPAAVHAGAKKVIACELNPGAMDFLRTNIGANKVEGKVETRLGDCRDVAPSDAADRVFMGYFEETHAFLPHALEALKPAGGTVHYHEVCPEELLPERPRARMEEAVARGGYKVTGCDLRKVKSYAPGVWHVVLDARLEPL